MLFEGVVFRGFVNDWIIESKQVFTASFKTLSATSKSTSLYCVWRLTGYLELLGDDGWFADLLYPLSAFSTASGSRMVFEEEQHKWRYTPTRLVCRSKARSTERFPLNRVAKTFYCQAWGRSLVLVENSLVSRKLQCCFVPWIGSTRTSGYTKAFLWQARSSLSLNNWWAVLHTLKCMLKKMWHPGRFLP